MAGLLIKELDQPIFVIFFKLSFYIHKENTKIDISDVVRDNVQMKSQYNINLNLEHKLYNYTTENKHI